MLLPAMCPRGAATRAGESPSRSRLLVPISSNTSTDWPAFNIDYMSSGFAVNWNFMRVADLLVKVSAASRLGDDAVLVARSSERRIG